MVFSIFLLNVQSNKDDFGSDPFAILHAPTSASQGPSGSNLSAKTNPPPRPESPSPALPPKIQKKQPPPRPAPPRPLQVRYQFLRPNTRGISDSQHILFYQLKIFAICPDVVNFFFRVHRRVIHRPAVDLQILLISTIRFVVHMSYVRCGMLVVNQIGNGSCQLLRTFEPCT